MSPEVLMKEDYDEGYDMWSLGVVAYILMSGCPPFFDENDNVIKKKIKTIDYDFDDKEVWGDKSK
jgi:serine/threonine protein kinase